MHFRHDVVRVLSESLLIDSSWRIQPYATRHRESLHPGLYLVLRRARLGALCFDGKARYFGPLMQQRHVVQLRLSALMFGLIAELPRQQKMLPAPPRQVHKSMVRSLAHVSALAARSTQKSGGGARQEER